MTNRPTRAQRQHGRRFLGLVLLLCVLAAVAVVGLIPRVAEPLLIAGIVVDDNGPIEGATVRIQASGVETRTDIQGRSALETGATSDVVTVSAWKHLYYCAKAEGIRPPAEGIELHLIRYQTMDNPNFEWTPPISNDPEAFTCALCKPGVAAIWLANAHAGSCNQSMERC